MKQKFYSLYKKMEDNALVATAASFAFTRIAGVFRKELPALPPEKTDESLPIVAFLCDEMTWQDFKNECRAVFVTPRNWQAAFKQYRPSFFFCESAWSGIENYPDCWRGRVYRNEKVRYENRRELFEILSYCQRNKIPTAFWNKEDPVFFGNETYDFVDTALRFDYIFTTAVECISEYERLGGKNVQLLQFGFSPSIFYPPDPGALRENVAVFAGSWFADQRQRCRDMKMLFDFVLEEGLELVIYNRQTGSSNPLHQYPERFVRYIRPMVPFERLGDIYRRAQYVINVNTVTGSDTMFARRVFEAMACGCIVISNCSTGLEAMFPKRIRFLVCPLNVRRRRTFAKRTWNMCLRTIPVGSGWGRFWKF